MHKRGAKEVARNMGGKPSELPEFNKYPYEDMNMGGVMKELNLNLGLPYYAIIATKSSAELSVHGRHAAIFWNQKTDASRSFLPNCRLLHPVG